MTDVPNAENVKVEEVVSIPVKQEEIRTPEDLKQTAQDALGFIKETCVEFLSPEFWGEVLSLVMLEGPKLKPAKRKRKPVEPPITPMTEEQAKRFGDEIIPYGKYVDSKVKTVFNKDREELTKLATKPHLFQKQLLRYLLFSDKQNKKSKNPRKTKQKASKKKK